MKTLYKTVDEYNKFVIKHLRTLAPFIQSYAMGDFTKEIPISDEESEFTEIYVGLRLMIDDIKYLMKEKDEAIKKARLYEQTLELHAKELAEVNKELQHFTYIVSHDLRAPLFNLKGFSAELQSSADTIQSIINSNSKTFTKEQKQVLTITVSENIPDALKFIDSSVTRMDNFINALLKLSRLGRRKLNFEKINMNDLVEQVIQSLTFQIKHDNVKIKKNKLPAIIADSTAMEQVMTNLINNAVNYLEPDRRGEIEIDAYPQNSKIVFRVCDNGRGIAESDKKKVFAPFRRAGKQNVKGEGMGLAYVQVLVQKHGGKIWFESFFGKGYNISLFRFQSFV